MRSLAILAGVLVVLLAAGVVARMYFSVWSGRQPEGDAFATNDGVTPAGADWRAEIALEQLSERNPDYEVSRLTVVLRDAKGRETETPDAQFELNGVPLTYRVGQGNYYDRHPYYRLDEESGFSFAADAPYELAMRRADGPALPFATIRTPKPLSPDDVRVPATFPPGRDFVIAWTGLSQPASLLIYRTQTFIDAQGNEAIEAGGPYGDDALRQHLGEGGLPLGEGSYTVPASYLAPAAGRRVTALGIEITAQRTGRFLHPVLAHSTVTATRKLVLRVDVAVPKPR